MTEFSFTAHSHCQVLTTAVVKELSLLQPRLRPEPRRYGRGEVVYLMGDETRQVFFVEEGRVKLSRVGADGREVILGIHEPGDIFGELCFCQVRARQEQAVAMAASSVLAFSADRFLQTLAEDADGLAALISTFCIRLGEAEDRLSDLSFQATQTRLARLLIALSRPLDADTRTLEGITHEELAAIVVASRELVTRLLNEFRRRGAIAYKRQGPIEVHSARLARAVALDDALGSS
ncbi:MAG: Crp/Fnr family transcriptional regulator [Chloroflexota bacterium]|nr:Crp/Fnr family transcriptional regulator [Chloroflexota bacterium]